MKESKLSIIYPIFLLLVSFPLIHAWLPITQRFIVLSVPLILCSLIFNKKAFVCPSIFAVIAYVLFLFCFSDRNSYISSIKFLDTAYLFSGVIISYYIIHNQNSRTCKQISFITYAFITITCVASIIICLNVPGAVRYNTINELNDIPAIVLAMQKFGLSNYLLPHALPILIPGIVKQIKDPYFLPQKKFYLKLFLGVIVIFEWYAESATGLILSIFALFASISIRINGKHNVRNIILLSIAALLLTSSTIMNPLIDLIITISPDSYTQKLIDLKLQLNGLEAEGDIYTRSNLYQDSLDVIFDNFLLGYEGNNLLIGGHSAILDHLATTGIVGFIPWALIFILEFKQVWKILNVNIRPYYIIGCICFILMLAIKNMSVYIVWLMFMVYLPTFLLVDHSK